MNFQQLREKYKAPYERELNEGLQDPPPVLVLRRTGIRDFATGERVALYYNSKLKLTFSVPYARNSVANVTAEQFINEGQVLKQLRNIVAKNEIKDVSFDNGGTTKVTATVAKNILSLHDQLNPVNQRKLSTMVSSAPENLNKVSEFAFKNLK